MSRKSSGTASVLNPAAGVASIDVAEVRAQFPALSALDDDRSRVYFDNPAGTQVPARVADRVRECLLHRNANLGGAFRTSALADAVVADARQACADLLNAPSPDEILFGQNMTTLTLHVSRSLGNELERGDEIVVTRMDHDANVYPWVLLARDLGLEIRWLPFDTSSYEFDLTHVDDVLTERTRLLCVGAASNLTGTINNVAEICRKARAAGAWTYIDAVQSVPHVATDVQLLGCDFLVCSAYKFFGPHQGVLWGRRDVLERLEPYKVRPAPDELPWRFETGTPSIEAIAGVAEAVDYLASIGAGPGSDIQDSRRRRLEASFTRIRHHEANLADRLVAGLQSIPGVTVHGITLPEAMHRRVPTVAFSHERMPPHAIAKALAEHNVFVWSGHNYALEAARLLGILESGTAVRIGAVHYNTAEEIDLTLNVLESILGRA